MTILVFRFGKIAVAAAAAVAAVKLITEVPCHLKKMTAGPII